MFWTYINDPMTKITHKFAWMKSKKHCAQRHAVDYLWNLANPDGKTMNTNGMESVLSFWPLNHYRDSGEFE
jgi:hypothetical protein